MEDSTSDYLTSYQHFFENFAANFNLNDPLPVITSYHTLEEYEIVGQVYEWCHRYLSARDCPENLIMLLGRATLDEMYTICKTDPEKCGYNSTSKGYSSYLFSISVIKKLSEICSRYSDNALLSSLPPPLNSLPVDYHGDKNLRPYMEDLHAVVHDLNALYNIQGHGRAGFYAIYDGHLGVRAAQYSVIHLHQYLAESKHYPSDPVEALKEAFEKTDLHFLHKKMKGGTTAVCLLHMIDKKKVYLAWVGDSEAALARAGNGIHLVKPHTADRPEEKKRIEDRGGTVVLYKGVWRVCGGLAISRAIGDQPYKSLVTADPDIVEMDVTDDMDFVILGSDGFWVVDTSEIISMVYQHLRDNKDLKGISKALCNVAAKDSQDNISALVVLLKEKESMDLSVQRPWEGNSEILGSERDINLQEESQDVGEESESEEEWDYIRGGTSNKSENKDQTASDMESQLNPNAAEFVPGVVSLESDVTLSASPCKGSEKSLENIIIPPEKDFDQEIATRPADLDDSFSLVQNGPVILEETDTSTGAVCGDESVFSTSVNSSSLTNGHNNDEEEDDEEKENCNPFMDNEDVNDVLSSPTNVEFNQDHFGKSELGFKPFEPMSSPITEQECTDSNIPMSLSAEISSHFNFIDSHLETSEKQETSNDSNVDKPTNFNFGNQLDFDEILQSKSNHTSDQVNSNPFSPSSEEKVLNYISSKESTANISSDIFGSAEVEQKFDFTTSDTYNTERFEEEHVAHKEESTNPFNIVETNTENQEPEEIAQDFVNYPSNSISDLEIVNENVIDNNLDIPEESKICEDIQQVPAEAVIESSLVDFNFSVNKIEEDAKESEIVNKVDNDAFDITTEFISTNNDIMTTSYHESYDSHEFNAPVQETTQTVDLIQDLEFTERLPETQEKVELKENHFEAVFSQGEYQNMGALSAKELQVGDEKYFMDKEDTLSPDKNEDNQNNSLVHSAPLEEVIDQKCQNLEENINIADDFQLTDHDSSFEVIHDNAVNELSKEQEEIFEKKHEFLETQEKIDFESEDISIAKNSENDFFTTESDLKETVTEENQNADREIVFGDKPADEEKETIELNTVVDEQPIVEEIAVVNEEPIVEEKPIIEESVMEKSEALVLDEPVITDSEALAPCVEADVPVVAPKTDTVEPTCNGYHEESQSKEKEASPLAENLNVAAATAAAVTTTAVVGAVAAAKISSKKVDSKSPSATKVGTAAKAAAAKPAPGKRPLSATKTSAPPVSKISAAPASKSSAMLSSKASTTAASKTSAAPPTKPTTLNTKAAAKPLSSTGKATSPLKPAVSKTLPAKPAANSAKPVGASKPIMKPTANTAKPKPAESATAKTVPSATSARPPSAKTIPSSAVKPAAPKPPVSKTAAPSAPKSVSTLTTAAKKPTAAAPSRPTSANKSSTTTKLTSKPLASQTTVKVSSTVPKPIAKTAPAATKPKPTAAPASKPAPIKAKAPLSAASKDKVGSNGMKKSTVAEKNAKNEVKPVKKPVLKNLDDKAEKIAPIQVTDETPEPVSSTTNGHIVDVDCETILAAQECAGTVI